MGNADSRNARKVRRAIRQNDAAALKKMVQQKIDLDLAINQYSRNTPLILAACYASVDVIPVVLKACSNKNATNAEGHTALDKGIIFYSLANEYHPNKTKELLRRRRVAQLLIDGGVSKVREGELELWIRVNKSDPVFLHTITHLFCRSHSTTLKSIGFAVMLRVNADLTCAACFLEAGASYHNYKMMYLSDLPSIDYKMPVNLAILILQSTSDLLILQHIENIFLSAYPATKTKDEAREQILHMLLQNDHVIRESHRKQYPEFDDLLEYHEMTIKPLKWLCRTVIRRNSYPNVFFAVHRLALPKKLENYLLLNDTDDAEDPTLNAADKLNMGSNPPSAQVVRRKPRPLSRIETDGRRRSRPLSHYHPADEFEREKRRHRSLSQSSATSAPASPVTTSSPLAAVHQWSPNQGRPMSQCSPVMPYTPIFQSSPQKDRPVSQYVPRQRLSQPSPKQVRPLQNSPQPIKSPVPTKVPNIFNGQLTPDQRMAMQERRTAQNIPLPPIPTSSSSPAQPPRQQPAPKNQPLSKSMNHDSPSMKGRPVSQSIVQVSPQTKNRPLSLAMTKAETKASPKIHYMKAFEPPPLPKASPKAHPSQLQQKRSAQQQQFPEYAVPQKQQIQLKPSPKVEGPQASPKGDQKKQSPKVDKHTSPKGNQKNMSPKVEKHTSPKGNQKNMSPKEEKQHTSPKKQEKKMSPKKEKQQLSSKGDQKKGERPHTLPKGNHHFVIQNIAVQREPGVNSLPRNQQPVLSTFAPPPSHSSPRRGQRSPRDLKKPRPHSHFVPASEVRNIFPPLQASPQASRNDEDQTSAAAEKRDKSRPKSYHEGYDAEFASHLEEALMKRRSQPPGQFLPTKEVLIDFGGLMNTIEQPYYSRSAGSTLTRQEVLLRPGSASLPRQDSNRRRSGRISPPSSPFNLVVNPRFIVAGRSQSKPEIMSSNKPQKKEEVDDSENEYDEINSSSSNSSSEEENSENRIPENEGYTRF